jgi:hypothetical protein
MAEPVTRREAFLVALARLKAAVADLDAVSIESGRLRGLPVPELGDIQRTVLLAYKAANEAYLKASMDYYGV